MNHDKSKAAAEARKLRASVKLMTRKRELRQAGLVRCCKLVFEKLLNSTQLEVDMTISDLITGEQAPEFLDKVQKALDCDPFMKKSQIYALMLEAWSTIYDIAKLNATIQWNELDLLRKRGADELDIIAADDILKKLQSLTANYNVKFSACRVLNLVEKGVYKPPSTVDEERKVGRKSFLGLSQAQATLDAVKKSVGVEELKKVIHQDHEDPNQIDVSNGAQPLHYACMNGKTDEVKVLLHAKSDVNGQTLRGFTPLHFAYQYDHNKCVKLLIAHKADVRCI